MKRVMVIGANGTGKTAFAQDLAEKTGLPLVRVDALHGQADGTPRPQADFLADLEAACQKPRWIIDGNDQATVPMRLAYADTVFFFDFSPTSRVWSAFRRSRKGRGSPRKNGGAERVSWKYYWRIWIDTRRQCEALRRSIKEADVWVVVFTKQRQARDYLARRGM